MIPVTRPPAFYLALLLLTSCEREVSDTERRVYSIDCGGSGCRLSLKKAESESLPQGKNPPTSGGEVQVELYDEGRILSACPTGPGQSIDCRPLTCDSSSLCAQLGGAAFSCEAGICEARERPWSFPDKLALCLAETGNWKGTPQQLERLSFARACRDPCTLPAQCHYP